MRRGWVGLVCGFGALALAPSAWATSIAVNTTSDGVAVDGKCSLREAILVVDGTQTADCPAVGSGDFTITLDALRYTLSLPPALPDTAASGDLDVTGALTISGTGAGTIIDGSGAGDRIFQVRSGGALTLRGLTLTGGHAANGAAGTSPGQSTTASPLPGGAGGIGENGGAVASDGTLTLDHVVVTASQAGDGGAGGSGGTSNNSNASGPGGVGGSGGEGGGVFSTGTLSVVDSTISNNRSGNGGAGGPAGFGTSPGLPGAGGVGHEDGGGIAVEGGTATITRSAITGNTAGGGGAGANGTSGSFGGTGAAGGAASWGGGLSFVGATATVTNSTISGNAAGVGGAGGTGGGSSGGSGGTGGPGGAGGYGGAIRSTNSTLTLTSDTISGNAPGGGGTGGSKNAGSSGSNGASGAAGSGGAFYAETTSPTVTSTIIASNSGQNCSPSGVAIVDGGGNLRFGDTSCPGTIPTGDPRLGALAANGGPTSTMAPVTGSAAIDAGGATCPAVDQRGVARPSGAACDIGAYEVAPPTVTTAAPSGVLSTTAVLNGSVVANQVGVSAHFEYGTTAAYGSQTPTVTETGTSTQLVAAPIAGLAPSTTYHVRLFAYGPDGASTGADQTFTTAAVPSTVDTRTSDSLGITAPAPAPVLTALTFAKTTFLSASVRNKKTKKITKAGTSLAFTLNVPATVTFTVARAGVGLKKGTKCTTLPKKPKKGSKHCVLLTTVGTITTAGKTGANTYAFTGKVKNKHLTKATYVLTAVAKDDAGRTSAAVIAKFKIS